jgi:hypothetical protein
VDPNPLPMLFSAGDTSDMKVPVMLINKGTGDLLTRFMCGVKIRQQVRQRGVESALSVRGSTGVYRGCTKQEVRTFLNYPMPTRHVVKWELWSAVDGGLANEFKKQFKMVAILLGNRSLFIPRYKISHGSRYNCSNATVDTLSTCSAHCIKNKYCSEGEHETALGTST